jgi:hypothetical protein
VKNREKKHIIREKITKTPQKQTRENCGNRKNPKKTAIKNIFFCCGLQGQIGSPNFGGIFFQGAFKKKVKKGRFKQLLKKTTTRLRVKSTCSVAL